MQVRSHCPINFTLEHFGDKWSFLIIRDLMFKGKRHYNEFLNGPEKVSTSVLGARLRMLEQRGIITQREDDVKKSRIKYSLTPKGIDLLPVLIELILWGGQHDSQTEAGPEFMARATNDRERLLVDLRSALERDHLGA